MRRGQVTLEYVLLIGLAAAGIILMIVYISRGHQGRLRSQADQLNTGQYAPGKTTIDNWNTKNFKSSVAAASSTTTINSEHPLGEINKTLEGDPAAGTGGLLGDIAGKQDYIYYATDFWEQNVVAEGIGVAEKVVNGIWMWTAPAGDSVKTEEELDKAGKELGDLNTLAKASADAWNKERKPAETTSGGGSSETGSSETTKHTNETLGAL